MRVFKKLYLLLIRLLHSKIVTINGFVDEVELLPEKRSIVFKVKNYKVKHNHTGIRGVRLYSLKHHVLFESCFPMIVMNKNDTLNITMTIGWEGGRKIGNKLKWVGDIRLDTDKKDKGC